MHRYTAYGLKIASELALPELSPRAGAGEIDQAGDDVIVRFGAAAPAPAGDGSRHWADPDEARLRFDDAAIDVRHGREICIEPAAGVDPRAVRLLALGPALAVLLHQRGLLVLHASAVALDRGGGGGEGAAVAFLGDKGQGKSTMAAAFHARGCPLVADDVIAVHIDPHAPDASVAAADDDDDAIAGRDVRPLVCPAYPQLKLWPASGALFGGEDEERWPRLHPDHDKRGRPAQVGFPARPLPLDRIYVLNDGDAESIVPLTGQRAFMAVVRHSYVLSLLSRTGTLRTHFFQVGALVARVPVRTLTRRRTLAALGEVIRLVDDDVAIRAG